MSEEQEKIFIEILSNFVSAKNSLLFETRSNMANFRKHYDIGSNLFKKYFPERPISEIDDIAKNCRTLYSEWTRTPYMTTYTGRRETWENYCQSGSNIKWNNY